MAKKKTTKKKNSTESNSTLKIEQEFTMDSEISDKEEKKTVIDHIGGNEANLRVEFDLKIISAEKLTNEEIKLIPSGIKDLLTRAFMYDKISVIICTASGEQLSRHKTGSPKEIKIRYK
jgi:hypothetical protein